jgi:hypothetical protein
MHVLSFYRVGSGRRELRSSPANVPQPWPSSSSQSVPPPSSEILQMPYTLDSKPPQRPANSHRPQSSLYQNASIYSSATTNSENGYDHGNSAPIMDDHHHFIKAYTTATHQSISSPLSLNHTSSTTLSHLSLPDPDVLAAKVRRPGDTYNAAHTLSPPPPWPSPPKKWNHSEITRRRDREGHHARSESRSPQGAHRGVSGSSDTKSVPWHHEGHAHDADAYTSQFPVHFDRHDAYRIHAFQHEHAGMPGHGNGNDDLAGVLTVAPPKTNDENEPDSVSKAIGLFRCVHVHVCGYVRKSCSDVQCVYTCMHIHMHTAHILLADAPSNHCELVAISHVRRHARMCMCKTRM